MVMRLFLKKSLRDIREARGQFASILLVTVIGVSFYIGLNSAQLNLQSASDKYFSAYRLADLWLSFQKAPETVLTRMKRFPEVKQVTGRVVSDQQLTIHQHDAVIRLITLPDVRQETVNDIMLKAGRYFTADQGNQCLVDEAFFQAQDLQFGDVLEPIINGNRVKLKVIGIVKSPEYLYQIRDSSEMVPDPFRFGIVYIKKSFGQGILGFNSSINDASVLLKPGTDSERIQRKMEKVFQKYGLSQITLKKDQISFNTFSGEIQQLSSLSNLFPIIFLIVAATIIYITMSRIVENQRVQLGTLKALGYGNFQIMLHYLSYAFFIGLAGNAFGAALGIYLSQKMMAMYNTIYQLPLEQVRSHYGLVLPALLLTMFFCLGAGYHSCRKELQLIPAESMRPKAPKTASKSWLEQIPALWRRFNFSWKIIFRNIFRYKQRALLTSVGIIFATALLLSALGLNDSIGFLIKQEYSTTQKYDLNVTFNQMLNPDELKYIRSLPHVSYVEPILGYGVEITSGWRMKKLGLTGLIARPKLFQISDQQSQKVAVPSKGILISQQLSDTLGATAGDLVQIKPTWPGKNSDQDRKWVRIQKVVAQYVGQSAYGGLDFCSRLLHEGPLANGCMIKLDDLDYQDKVTAKIKEMPTVASIQSRTVALSNLLKAESQSVVSIGIMILASGLLAFAVIYNITTINIFERRRELATLKVLGFTSSEMRQLVFNENLIITVLAMGCGLLVGGHLLNYLCQSAGTDNINFPAVINGPSYILASALVMFFSISANLILMNKIHDINMVEALKSSE